MKRISILEDFENMDINEGNSENLETNNDKVIERKTLVDPAIRDSNAHDITKNSITDTINIEEE